MKKVILFTAVAVVFFTTFESCKKESTRTQSPVVYPVQPGTVAQLSNGIAFQSFSSATTYEMGVAFKSSVNGNIKSLKLKLPATGSKLVTLWKVSDQSVVQSATIICSHINSWDDSTAVNIPIEANTEYMLSINSNSYYYANVSTTTFPYINENIIILSFKAIAGPAQTFPTTDYNNAVFGLVDFTFQKASS